MDIARRNAVGCSGQAASTTVIAARSAALSYSHTHAPRHLYLPERRRQELLLCISFRQVSGSALPALTLLIVASRGCKHDANEQVLQQMRDFHHWQVKGGTPHGTSPCLNAVAKSCSFGYRSGMY